MAPAMLPKPASTSLPRMNSNTRWRRCTASPAAPTPQPLAATSPIAPSFIDRCAPYNRRVAVRRAVVSAGESTNDREAVIIAEGVSKQYPRDRVRLFPPVVMFHRRDWFRRRRSTKEEEPNSAAEASSEQDSAAHRARADARRRREYELDYEDLDDEDDDDDDDFEEEPPARVGGSTPMEPGEMFWALKDVSFSLEAGGALGILGGPGAGKTTLLKILGGRAFPTEGRVLTRGTVAPTPGDLAKAIALSGKGYFQFDLVMGCRLLGLHPHVVKPHRQEIEDLAQPLLDKHGEPAPGAMTRLAVATAVTLPSDAILFEDGLPGMDEAFTERILDRLRRRLRSGTAVVCASRRADVIEMLCDEVIVLDGGAGGGPDATGDGTNGYESVRAVAPKRAAAGGGLGERALSVPPEPVPFHSSAALLSVEVQTADGGRSKRLDGSEELSVVIRLETALRDTEIRCGVCFTPRSGESGVRIEHPEPLRLRDPGLYEVRARLPAGTVAAGGYKVHADAVVATATEEEANAISRDAGRLRIEGDHPSPREPTEDPSEHWDGCVLRRAEAEWSIE